MLGIGGQEKVVLCVGMTTPEKGLADFLRVAEANPGLLFVWVGGRPFSLFTAAMAEVRALAESAPPNVRLAGVLPFSRMPAVYNAADCLLFPSYHETFGLVVAEAAACGLPLVLRDLPHYREVFGQGYLAAGTAGELAACVRRVFTEPGLAAALGSSALALAGRCSERRAEEALLGAYRELDLRRRRAQLDSIRAFRYVNQENRSRK